MADSPGAAGDAVTADVLVVGGGAAGLWCAEGLARGSGLRVLVVEKTPRTGTKILASGGTRCNVTTTLGPSEAAALFGPKGARFLRHGFQTLTPLDVRERFESWGVPLDEAPLQKVFPASGNARDVRDALLGATQGAGAELVLDAPVEFVRRENGTWVIGTASGARYAAPRVVLAAGGLSYPKTGTTGDGYAWLRELGLGIVEPVPALVPLRSPAEWVHSLTGIAWQGGEVTLVDGEGKKVAQRSRPILFTHKGVSGPGAMDVSHHVSAARRNGMTGPARFRLRFDAFPALSREELRAAFVGAAGSPGNPKVQRVLGTMATGPMPRRLFDAFAEEAKVPTDVVVGGLSKSLRHALVETLKGLDVPIDGTLGWDQAEVTAGGLALKHVNPRTMAVNGHDGLFVIGELLDVNGPIGGLSFQAAFATAELAALAIRG